MSQTNSEFFHEKILPNGLRVLVHEMPYASSVTVEIKVKAGSRYEPIPGISHFLEHMIGEGSKNYPSPIDIIKAIKRFGGMKSFWTGLETVSYLIKVPFETKTFAFQFLKELLFNPLMTSEAIKREKKIILREYNEYINDPIRYTVDGMLPQHLWGKDNPLGRSSLGTKQSILAISRDALLDFHQKFYTPSNIVLSIAGNITKEEAFELSSTNFGDLPSSKVRNLKPPHNFYLPINRGVLIGKRNIGEAFIALGIVTDITFHDQSFPSLSILNSLIGDHMFNKFVYDASISYTAGFRPISVLFDHSTLTFFSQVSPKKVEKGIKLLVNEINRIEINDQVLQDAKNSTKSSLFLSFADTDDYADFIGMQKLLWDYVKSPKQFRQEINQASLEDVFKLKEKYINSKHSGLVILGPVKTSLQKKFNQIFSSME
jgi:predicted Zn-dependent peptidase